MLNLLLTVALGGIFPLYFLILKLWGHISPMYSRVGLHVFLLPLFLYRIDEPAKLLPSVFIKMAFIHLNFNLMPTHGCFCRYSNKPIYKCQEFLLLKLAFLLALITDMLKMIPFTEDY